MLGFATFMLWQGTYGLLPGKQSTIKWIYFAHAAPFFIPAVVVGARSLGRAGRWALGATIAAIFALALPIAMF